MWFLKTILLVAVFVYSEVALSTPLGRTTAIACAPSNSDVAAAIVDSRVWVTFDRGVRWRFVFQMRAVENVNENLALSADKGEDSGAFRSSESSIDDDLEERREDEAAPSHRGQVDMPFFNQSTALLTVSNAGTVAVVHDEAILIGRPGRGVVRVVDSVAVRDTLFDKNEGLWVLSDTALFHYSSVVSNGYSVKMRRVVKPLALELGTDTPHILLLDELGISKVSIDDDSHSPRRVLALSGISAFEVGKTSARESNNRIEKDVIYFNAFGMINRQTSTGVTQKLQRLSFRISQIEVAGDGRIRVHSEDRGWLELNGASIRPLDILSTAVDAEGGFWEGTTLGPRTPKPIGIMGNRTKKRQVLHFALPNMQMDVLPKPPPCRCFHLNPLPVIAFSVAHDKKRHASLEQMLEQMLPSGFLREAWHIGIYLTWRFKPISHYTCIRSHRRYLDQMSLRRTRIAELWNHLLHAESQEREAHEMSSAIYAKTEREQIEQLFQIMGVAIEREGEKHDIIW